jgi:hypothetical protein
MADQRFRFIKGEHFRLCSKLGFILGIVDFGVTSRNNQDSVTIHPMNESVFAIRQGSQLRACAASSTVALDTSNSRTRSAISY